MAGPPGLPVPPAWCGDDPQAVAEAWLDANKAAKAGAVTRFLGFRDLNNVWDGTPAGFLQRAELRAMNNVKPKPGGKPGEMKGDVTFLSNIFRFGKIGLLILGSIGDFVMSVAQLPGGANVEAVKSLLVVKMFRQVVNKFAGVNVEFPGSNGQYTLNWLNPTVIESTGEALAGYLSDQISIDEYLTLAKANGQCERAAKLAADVGQQRLGPNEINDLRHRGLDPLKWADRLRELGYIDPDTRNDLFDLSAQRLAVDQITQLYLRGEMGRDRWEELVKALGWADESARQSLITLTRWQPDLGTTLDWADKGIPDNAESEQYQFDTNFNASYTPQIAAYLATLGIDKDAAKLLWRGHWNRLDLASAYQMFQRFRPGSVPPEIAFGENDLRDAIRLSGARPDTWERLVRLANPPIGIRQLNKPYEYGIIDDDRLLQGYQDIGFSQADAQILLAQARRDKITWQRGEFGAPNAAALVKQFAAGELTTAELGSELAGAGYDADLASKALIEARVLRARNARTAIMGQIKRSYLAGEISDAQSSSALLSIGLDPEAAAALVGEWRAISEVNPKQIPAAELLGWYQQGLISAEVLAARLALLRFTAADIGRMIAVADLKVMKQHEAEATKLAHGPAGKIKGQLGGWGKILNTLKAEFKDVAKGAQTPAGKILSTLESQVALVEKLATQQSSEPKITTTLRKALADQSQTPAAPAAPETPQPIPPGQTTGENENEPTATEAEAGSSVVNPASGGAPGEIPASGIRPHGSVDVSGTPTESGPSESQ